MKLTNAYRNLFRPDPPFSYGWERILRFIIAIASWITALGVVLASLLFEGGSDENQFFAGAAGAIASFGIFSWLVLRNRKFYPQLLGIVATFALLLVALLLPSNWQAVISMFAVLGTAGVQAFVALRGPSVKTVLNA